MKTQLNARLSEATRAKLDDLTSAYGTQAEVLAVAIDRLYTATFQEDTHAWRTVQPGEAVNWLDR